MLSELPTPAATEIALRGVSSERRGRSVAASISLPDLAELVGAAPPDSPDLANVRFALRHCNSGQPLVRNGDPLRSMYAVRRGMFKQVGMSSGGSEQVLSFPAVGDVIGAEGIDAGVHQADVTALNDAEVAILPIALLDRLEREYPVVGQMLSRICGKELNRAIESMWMLGILGATARVALFLIRLSARLAHGGVPRRVFDLPMTRAEIGSFLGISVETVSRALGSLSDAGLITVRQREIGICDYAGLQAVTEYEGSEPLPRRRYGAEDGLRERSHSVRSAS